MSTQLTQIYNVWEAIHQSIRLKKLKQKVNYTNPQQQQQREAITLEAKGYFYLNSLFLYFSYELELKSTQKLIFTRIMGVLTTLFSLISSLAPTQIAQQSIKLITQIYKVIGNFYKDVC